MRAVILSGGQGLRLRPLTDDRPKPLVPVNGKPISEHQIDWLMKDGVVDSVIFACGYKWEKLREHYAGGYKGVKVDFSVEEEALGTGGGIKRALGLCGDDEECIALNCDVVTDLGLKRVIDAHHASSEAAATMLVVPYRSRFGVVRIDKLKTVRGFEEKPAFPDVWINGGIYVLNIRRTLKYLPDKGDVERDTFPRMAERGELMSYPYYGDWRIMDSIKDLKELEDELKVR